MIKKLAYIHVHFFGIVINCKDWAKTGQIGSVKIKSTLECNVKTRALKGIFLVC